MPIAYATTPADKVKKPINAEETTQAKKETAQKKTVKSKKA